MIGKPTEAQLPLDVAEDVAAALAQGAPIVALETTLVAHGFPAGRGARVALETTAAIEEQGATAASIGLVDGRIRIGLDRSELDRFSVTPDARKVGARDLASCLSSGELGATTVGATLAICRLLGVSVLATGGIGGVHRGYAEHLDVSSDLRALAETRVALVCSGAKSLLDVNATSELLESLSVPVLGWQTETLPLFYSRDGGPAVERVDDARQLATIAATHWALGGRALVIARPPDPDIPCVEAEALFDEALQEAERAGVRGSALTPFVLARAHEASSGATLEVNERLIVDNARLAARLARSLSTRAAR